MTTPDPNLPEHIAIIMDGNGRWAKQRGLPRVAGHRAGIKTLRNLVEHIVALNIPAMTVFAFSTENWQRPRQEVKTLMDLFMSALNSEVNDLNKNNVCLKLIGDRHFFSDKLREAVNEAESLTAANTGLNLNVAINYSGRWDILQACQSLIDKFSNEQVTEAMLAEHLSLSSMKEPDLFIRTGGERRISNYLLWQLAYTELYFVDTLWPDFNPEEMDDALNWFANRERRYGKISEQLADKA
ncbi:MAG: polyprenyl diphosphate synthase [Pseudomonadota bacterium]